VRVKFVAVSSGREWARSEEAEQRGDLPLEVPIRWSRGAKGWSGRAVQSLDGWWAQGGAWLMGRGGETPQKLVQ
jgi:hypothetical protein